MPPRLPQDTEAAPSNVMWVTECTGHLVWFKSYFMLKEIGQTRARVHHVFTINGKWRWLKNRLYKKSSVSVTVFMRARHMCTRGIYELHTGTDEWKITRKHQCSSLHLILLWASHRSQSRKCTNSFLLNASSVLRSLCARQQIPCNSKSSQEATTFDLHIARSQEYSSGDH